MDRRLTPTNGRVAASYLEGQVSADSFVGGVHRQVVGSPFLLDAPNGNRDRQLLCGDDVQIYEETGGWLFVQSMKDGYVGYLPPSVTNPLSLTHRVNARTSWLYPEANFKLPALDAVHLNSRVQVLDLDGKWARVVTAATNEASEGAAFIPTAHLTPLDTPERDPVAVAERFLGTPYVWAGNTGFGIDCSGLIQAALLACAIPCPGDSDMQEALGADILGATPLQRGDLLFWKGHVAMVVDPNRVIHANAHHMMVAYEELDAAIDRIAAQGDGPVTARRRL